MDIDRKRKTGKNKGIDKGNDMFSLHGSRSVNLKKGLGRREGRVKMAVSKEF
jgi:hypothetical protein